jgi:hypothetical protein
MLEQELGEMAGMQRGLERRRAWVHQAQVEGVWMQVASLLGGITWSVLMSMMIRGAQHTRTGSLRPLSLCAWLSCKASLDGLHRLH